MTILLIRSDGPKAELYLYSDQNQLDKYAWHAGRELSDTLLLNIKQILAKNKMDFSSLQAVAVFAGPGSFTGLRISHTVANALAFAQGIPVVNQAGDDWIEKSIVDLLQGKNKQIVTPDYGRDARITTPRK